MLRSAAQAARFGAMNTLMNELRLRAFHSPYGLGVNFHLIAEGIDARGQRRILAATKKPVEIEPVEEMEALQPLFMLSKEQTQDIVDCLWSLGFRPSEGTGSAGAMAATERHLADMQKLVFGHSVIKHSE